MSVLMARGPSSTAHDERIAMLRRPFKSLHLIRFNNLFLILLCLALGGSLASGGYVIRHAAAETSTATNPEQKALLHALEDAFTSIADQVEPAVVSVEAKSNARPAADQRAGGNQDDP